MKKVVFLVLVSILLSLTVVADSLPVHIINSGKVITQTDPATTVYLDPPTINGTAIGVNNTVTVNINIKDAHNIFAWQAGLTFNATLLNCTGFEEGEFLSSVGSTQFPPVGKINNTLGMIRPPYYCILTEDIAASGDGRLAYATFKVKATGVSDIHLSDSEVLDYDLHLVPINIIDVYTVVVDTTSHTVVMVSNLTGSREECATRFYDHAYSIPAEKISFKVAGPYTITDISGIHEVYGSFSNVTIPKTLLNISTLDQWRVKIDGKLLSTEERIITENDTHTSIYFTYSAGFHYVQITTRPLINSIISITPSLTNYTVGSNITIGGYSDPVRPGVKVTILWFYDWTTLATVTTDPNSHYSYTWTPEKNGIYQFMAMWEGDDNTFGDVSYVLTLRVPTYLFVFEVEGFQAIIQTNSTISAFNFSQPLKQINFNATGSPGTIGFCNISIPDNLLSGEFSVYMDGSLLVKDENYIQTYNGTHYIFCITYTHSTHVIEIRGTEVIPEIPTWTSMLLILILLTVAIATYKRRLLKISFR